ncbi:pirin family protein [Cellulomonas chengniuliangii]|uniref:Pirin family protein n=1 Tax=Cellulomonas chengniuliangii TaxID=2968084 RepID=A0ABY5KTW6_9CELL|nr:pirin family protein [Cellulomonas chengniuliangii]MCC2308515.1 pirin family protein [Cellulomonas chengniuliangii]UUI73879.1 pirin family protein [Cellulomonas chengniuliangii]
MTNLETQPQESELHADQPGQQGSGVQLLEPREVPLGGVRGMRVRRTLPQRGLPMVGAWCFLDEFGPVDVDMRVLPHPHTGLQTVTWPLVGEIRHRDSAGSDVVVRPGQLNLMTAGRGVAHSEMSLGDRPLLHGVQLWIALPSAAADITPRFEQHTDLPVLAHDGLRATVLVGELEGARSAATVHSPLIGVELALSPGASTALPLRPGFEHALLVLDGALEADGVRQAPGPLRHLATGLGRLALRSEHGARALLIGGEPFAEDLVMWWNFLGRSHADILEARDDWERRDGTRFGAVAGHGDARIPAPDLPRVRLTPRRRRRP